MTIPESLVDTIKALVKAHEAFAHEVEELQALSLSMKADIDRLVSRQNKLADMHLADRAPVPLPKAIVPREAAE